MSSAESRGQFVWHELMTTDIAGAGAFYPRVAGWKTQPWDKDSSYTLWVGNAGPAGGVMSLPEEAPAASHWMPYIAAPDMAGTIELARRLGGTVCKDVTEIPGAGRFAVLQDPQGAAFAVFTSAMPQQQAGESNFSWHELATADFEAALGFYRQLFGWGKGPTHDMGELGYYQIFTQGGKNIGGIYNMPPGVTTSHWLSYVRVNDVDKAANAAKAAGGRVVNGPMEVPGGDWIAQIVDPQGAAFAVHQLKAPANAAPKAQSRAVAPKRAAAKKKAARKRVAIKAKSSSKRKSARKPKRVAAKRGSASRMAKRAVKKPAKRARRKIVRRVAKKKSSRRLRARRRR